MAPTASLSAGKRYSIFVDEQTDELLGQLAKLDYCAKTSLVNRALRDYVERRKSELEPRGNGGAHEIGG